MDRHLCTLLASPKYICFSCKLSIVWQLIFLSWSKNLSHCGWSTLFFTPSRMEGRKMALTWLSLLVVFHLGIVYCNRKTGVVHMIWNTFFEYIHHKFSHCVYILKSTNSLSSMISNNKNKNELGQNVNVHQKHDKVYMKHLHIMSEEN